MLMMRAKVQGHRWVDHPAAAVMEARVPGQWVDRPAAMVMEAREQGRCWIDHPAAAVMEARVQGRHWVDRPSVRATFVRSYSQFWVNVKSNVLVDSALGAGQTSCTSQPAAPAGTIQKDPECGKTKGCYSDCSGSDCKFLMTWAASTMADNVLITLKGKVGTASNRYIAFGLSNDKKMGADSVNYCINELTGVYSSYNDGKSNKQLANSKEHSPKPNP
ncbi:hypothetical protein ACOMHN_002300 [Nucella lapillus]